MNKKYIVRLTQEEREQLKQLISKGRTAAYKIKHANILLKADADGEAWTDEKIARAFSVHTNTVVNVRERFVMEGLESALNRKKREKPPRERILDGEKEARLIAVSCSEPPAGYARWTLRLMADKLVELEIVESISHETVRQALKKTS
jgi:transposase